MINSSDPSGAPVMRTIYLRASTQTSAIVPPATDPATNTSPDDGVVSLVSRAPATNPAPANPTAARPVSIDGGARSDVAMEMFAWQTAQAMLANPMQALRSQSAPDADSVTALFGYHFG